MDTLTRRRFLLASGVTAGAALVGGATTLTGPQLARALQAAGAPVGGDGPRGRARTLVLVTLYGGNDGLGTVVPAGDPAYQDARPELAYDPDEVLDLGDGLGLNPAMTGLHRQWQAGRLAIVRGVGYPRPDRSHFRSMAIWQTADPGGSSKTGWLGRWLDATGRDPLRAIAIGGVLPPALAGATTAGAAVPLTGLRVPATGATLAGLGALAAPVPGQGEPELQAAARTGLKDLLGSARALEEVGASDPEDEDSPEKEGGATTGGQRALAAQLAVVRRCIASGLRTRVYAVSLGGFDTHADEKGAQTALLQEVDEAVSGFLEGLDGTAGGDGVVVAVYSEFGRRVRANAADGTDHGTAGPVLLAGAPVRGGFVGDQPSLTDLDDGDLKVTTDFRDVYATLLEGVLDTDPGRVLGDWGRRVPVLL